MKKFFSFATALAVAFPVWASEPEISEFCSEETLESGFLTSALNSTIEGAMSPSSAAPASAAAPAEGLEYGRAVTGFVSAPKFGGYVISRYQYSDQDKAHGGAGFNQRLVRFYVDGTILKDFAYRIQIQTNNDAFHMKDFFVEWRKYKFAQIKVGQFKRAFGFENPMNPWDISTGDYSLMTKYLTGHSDYLNFAKADIKAGANGGRDLGVQVQGDFMPIGADNHNLFHYQVMVSNGGGINASDTDGKKDVTATLQVQPVKGLFLGAFGWKGSFKTDGVEHSRNRYAFGVKYDKNGYCLRSEYAHGQSDLGNADAWYAVAAAPINDWFRLSAQYQTARIGKSWSNAQCVYSLIPEFQLHKNLKLQLQYNWNDNRGAADKHFNELWAEFYFRF